MKKDRMDSMMQTMQFLADMRGPQKDSEFKKRWMLKLIQDNYNSICLHDLYTDFLPMAFRELVASDKFASLSGERRKHLCETYESLMVILDQMQQWAEAVAIEKGEAN